jgi:hypothetical protein
MNICMSRFTRARAGTGGPQSLSAPQEVDLTRLMLWRSMRKHIYRYGVVCGHMHGTV